MSGTSPVLVVTRLDDETADVAIDELCQRSVPVVRLDPGDFPEKVLVAARVDGRRLTGEVWTESRELALGTVRSVYWRRPRPYSTPEGLNGQDADWCVQQARHGLGGS
ncbi:MvdC/MvdD family ATP grasp protein [Streptomyces coelicoflavus]|uniref:MvdC/MvdD family ATP grasp protein n=1 Tax=Streptomyces coelicoflavus TaxID=285562 RepID=UPI00366231F1